MGRTIDGVNGDHILLAQPFIIEDSYFPQITERLAQLIQSTIQLTHKKSKRFLPHNQMICFNQQTGKFSKKGGGWV